MATGISVAGNVAVLSVVDRVLFRAPAQVTEASALRRVYLTKPSWNRPYVSEHFSFPDFKDLSEAAGSGSLAAFATAPERFVREIGRRVTVSYVSDGYFSTLGVGLARGRLFDAGPTQAILSSGLWRSSFADDPSVIGRTLTVDNASVVVVGVASGGFVGVDVDPVDIWLPLRARPDGNEGALWHNRSAPFLSVVARGGDRSADIGTKLTSVFRRARAFGEAEGDDATVLLAPLAVALGPGERLPLEGRNLSLSQRLSAVSVAVLLVVVVGSASLLLLRAVARQHEIRLRLALGLTRERLALTLLLELGVIGAAAAVAAVVLSKWGTRVLQVTLLSTVRGDPVELEPGAALGAALLSVVAVFVAGLGAQLFLLRTPVQAPRSAFGLEPSGVRLRSFAIASQTALSVFLVSLSGMLFIAVRPDLRQGLAMAPDRLIAVSVGGQLAGVNQQTLSRIRSLAFVSDAAVAMAEVPPGRALTRVERFEDTREEAGAISFNAVDTGYFNVIGLSADVGRVFQAADSAGADPVVVPTSATAKTLWGDENPIGKCLAMFGEKRCVRVVGVVPDVHWDVSKPLMPHIYVPLQQAIGKPGHVVVLRTRGAASPRHVVELERALAATDSNGAAPNVYLVKDRLERQLGPLRVASRLLLIYAAIAIVAGVVGTYGRVAQEIRQRKRELGVRAALGASPIDLLSLTVTSGIRTVGVGLLVGVVLTAMVGGLMSGFVFGASADNPGVLSVVVASLLVIDLAAMMMAARFAAVLSPATMLRID